MKLYLISQSTNQEYDTYDSAVVAAETEDDARNMHPEFPNVISHKGKWMDHYKGELTNTTIWTEWVNHEDIDKIEVKYLGETNVKRGVVLGSFQSG